MLWCSMCCMTTIIWCSLTSCFLQWRMSLLWESLALIMVWLMNGLGSSLSVTKLFRGGFSFLFWCGRAALHTKVSLTFIAERIPVIYNESYFWCSCLSSSTCFIFYSPVYFFYLIYVLLSSTSLNDLHGCFNCFQHLFLCRLSKSPIYVWLNSITCIPADKF